MKNNELYDSENDPMTLGELKARIDKVLEYNPQFINADVYAEGDHVRHRMVGIVHKKDRERMSGREVYALTLLDESGVDYEKELQTHVTSQMEKDAEDL